MTDPRPCCLHCGVALKKHTVTLWFEPGEPRNIHPDWAKVIWLGDRPRPQTKAEAARYSNLPVVYANIHNEGVMWVSTWDGESYGLWGENLFCTKECGYQFGREVAKLLKEKRKL